MRVVTAACMAMVPVHDQCWYTQPQAMPNEACLADAWKG